MKNYKVLVTNGKYNAPAIYLTASRGDEAEKEAKQKSGLGRFENWLFIAYELK